jgi:hypothetical protein
MYDVFLHVFPIFYVLGFQTGSKSMDNTYVSDFFFGDVSILINKFLAKF